MKNLQEIGLKPELLDLKDYFESMEKLRSKISEYGGVWVTGGNTFVLAYAYEKSGFGQIVHDLAQNNPDFVYAGFSAGGCILQHKLKGIDFVDDPKEVQVAYGEDAEVIWQGVGLIDFVFVPHYDSDHPESEDTNEEIEYYDKNNIPYKTFRDGEVYIDKVEI